MDDVYLEQILMNQELNQALYRKGSLLLCYFLEGEMIFEEVILSSREMMIVRRRERSSQRLMKQYEHLFYVSRTAIREEKFMEFLEHSHPTYDNALVI